MFQWIGYLGSVLVTISITINGGLYFRILNIAGSICMVIYAYLIGGWPVFLINIYCIGINIYHIIKINRNKNNAIK